MEADAWLTRLESRVPAHLVDWERILEANYRTLLPAHCGVVDVGAHTGRHTDVFLRGARADRVVVVEPLPRLADALRQRFADDARVRVVEAALGTAPGQSTFVVNEGGVAESGLRRRHYTDESEAHTREITVSVTTLDDLDVAGRVHWVKLDIEGGEIDALRGGADLFQRDRPLASVEYGRSSYEVYGHEADTLWDVCRDRAYVIADLFGHVMADRDEWRACVDRYYWDYLLVPRERQAAFERFGPRLRRRAAAVLAATAAWQSGRRAGGQLLRRVGAGGLARSSGPARE